MGPCELVDLVGIDVHVHASEALYSKLREPRMAPPPRLVAMKNAGLLGRKTGRGFYTYERPGSPKVVDAVPRATDAEPAGITTVGVVGSGTMATGIVEVFAKAGYDVISVTRGQEKSAAGARSSAARRSL